MKAKGYYIIYRDGVDNSSCFGEIAFIIWADGEHANRLKIW